MTRRAIAPGEKFVARRRLPGRAVHGAGKSAALSGRRRPETAVESGANVGVEIIDGDKRLAFVPGAAAVTPALRERLSRADVVLFDGTLFTDDEMIRTGTGTKTGRRMGHMPIDGEGGSLAALAGLAARRIFMHINNTNPILIDGSPERAAVEAAGWEVAADGLEIVL